jgi:hypothetical protein
MANLDTNIQPFNLQKGFNNIVIRAHHVSTDDVDFCFLEVRNDFTNEIVILQRAWVNGIADFEISSVVKYFFNYSHRAPLYNADEKTGNILVDRGLYADYSYRTKSGPNTGAWQNRIVLNAVSQFEHGSVDMAEYQGKLLSRQKRFTKYPGLPLVLSFLNFPNRNAYVFTDGYTILDNAAGQFPAQLSRFDIVVKDDIRFLTMANFDVSANIDLLTDNSGNSILAGDNAYVIISIDFPTEGLLVEQVVDIFDCQFNEDKFFDRYFYVRWVNDIGGWEYAMFSYRTTEEHKIGKGLSFIRYAPRNFVTDFEQTINNDLVRTLTCGMQSIEGIEFDRIRGILKSPKIETYSEIRKQKQLQYSVQLFPASEDSPTVTLGGEGLLGWVPLTIASAKFNKDNRETRQNCEITFNLPPTKLQY